MNCWNLHTHARFIRSVGTAPSEHSEIRMADESRGRGSLTERRAHGAAVLPQSFPPVAHTLLAPLRWSPSRLPAVYGSERACYAPVSAGQKTKRCAAPRSVAPCWAPLLSPRSHNPAFSFGHAIDSSSSFPWRNGRHNPTKSMAAPINAIAVRLRATTTLPWLQHHAAPIGPTRLPLLEGGVDACV